jgi:Mrp family chromosome partitioning ATPase
MPTVITELEETAPIRAAAHPLPAGASDRRLAALRAPDAIAAAGFRVLRHRLRKLHDPRVIVVSSAERGEGRTTGALGLASALAEDRASRVLLLEADARAPALAQILCFEPPWCFLDQLAQHRDQPARHWSVVRIDPVGLHVTVIDPRSRLRRRIDDGPALAAALARFRSVFDYVVVDAPPILESAEVNALQELADGVLVILRSGRSRGRAVTRALEQLEPGPVLGVALLSA